jgi:hypothetical protein
MNERQLNAFAEANLENSFKLAIARDLERLYSPLVTEPIPPKLTAKGSRPVQIPAMRETTAMDPVSALLVAVSLGTVAGAVYAAQCEARHHRHLSTTHHEDERSAR